MTLEYGRRLQYFHRYQKLALDEELKRMEEMANENSLQELPAVVPILQRIATDTSVINPVRARAQRMIERAGASPEAAKSDAQNLQFKAYLRATKRSKRCSNRVSEEGSLGR